MFGLGPATKIYVAVEAVDMRKGFDGLYGLVRDELGAAPLSGHLFLFTNRSRTRIKALVWGLRGGIAGRLARSRQKNHVAVGRRYSTRGIHRCLGRQTLSPT
jgi:transposase